MTKFKKELTATKMRLILVSILVLFVILIFVAIYFGTQILSKNSDSLTNSVTESESTENLLNQIKTAKNNLDKQKSTVEKAKKIIATSKNYKYQEEFLRDINHYASMSQLEVNSYNFEVPTERTGGSSTGAAAPISPSSSGSTTGSGTTNTIAPPGTKITNATISIKGTVKYSNFLKFLKLVENNVVRMRIKDLNISSQKTESGDIEVSVPSIIMEIYIKNE